MFFITLCLFFWSLNSYHFPLEDFSFLICGLLSAVFFPTAFSLFRARYLPFQTTLFISLAPVSYRILDLLPLVPLRCVFLASNFLASNSFFWCNFLVMVLSVPPWSLLRLHVSLPIFPLSASIFFCRAVQNVFILGVFCFCASVHLNSPPPRPPALPMPPPPPPNKLFLRPRLKLDGSKTPKKERKLE